MRDNYVVLNGGLGNQLWQLSFAHKLADLRLTKVVHIHNEKNSHTHLLDGASIISMLIKECRHNLEFNSHNFSSPYYRRKFVPESNWSKLGRRRFLDSRNLKVQDFDGIDISRPFIHLGFFQSLEFLAHEVSIVLAELEILLHFYDTGNDMNMKGEYAVIHLRGGDYYQERHRESLGVLSNEYYSQLIVAVEKLGVKKVFVVTDDWTTAEARLKNIEGVELIKLDGLNEIATFQLMAGAKVVGVSNSSFAWWGGMLCKKAGGSMIVPVPWYQIQKKTGVSVGVYEESMIKLLAHYSY